MKSRVFLIFWVNKIAQGCHWQIKWIFKQKAKHQILFIKISIRAWNITKLHVNLQKNRASHQVYTIKQPNSIRLLFPHLPMGFSLIRDLCKWSGKTLNKLPKVELPEFQWQNMIMETYLGWIQVKMFVKTVKFQAALTTISPDHIIDQQMSNP